MLADHTLAKDVKATLLDLAAEFDERAAELEAERGTHAMSRDAHEA